MQIGPIAIIRFHDVPTRFWFENALQFGALLTGIVAQQAHQYRGAGGVDCNLCLCGGDELHPAGPAVMLKRTFAVGD